MKRKVVAILLAMALSVSITGCTNMNEEASGQASSQEVTSAQSSQEEITESESQSASEAPGQEEAGQTIPVEMRKESILYYGYGDYVFYGIDQLGNKLYEYHWNDVCKELKDKGYDFSGASAYTMGDGYLFINNYENLGTYWGSRTYAVDSATLNVIPLWTTEENTWISGMDYYDGKIYITVYGTENLRKEYVYAREGSTFAFQGDQGEKESYFQALGEYGISPYSAQVGDRYGGCSITRAMEEHGYVVGSKDNVYYKITKDGMVSRISAIPEGYMSISGYDQNGVVFVDSDEDGIYSVYYADYSSGSVRKMGEAKEANSFLAYQDGKVYYCVSKSINLVLTTNSVYQYDVTTGENRKLYEKTSTPGASLVQPGTQGFKLVNGKIFFIDLVGDDVEWVTGDPKAGTFALNDTGFVVEERTAFHYGTVIYYEYNKNCPSCGTPLNKYYGEAFQLNKRYSAFADQINEVLRGEPEAAIASYDEPSEYAMEGSCEDHLENPSIWCETVENEVTGVKELGNHYLAVEYSGYWYGGGAHGYPSIEQYLFDLETGKQLTLKDFYMGSEESFKELVAQKTKEDFLSYEEGYSPYFSDNASAVYNDAYKYASIEGMLTWFNEDGIEVIYPPYDMGPYASGFISVFISYEELLGRSGL